MLPQPTDELLKLPAATGSTPVALYSLQKPEVQATANKVAG
jgi:hypothetical protein